MANREWSPQQRAVFEFVSASDKRHAIVEALAGSGKTTTIVEALRNTYKDDRVLMAAFNKSIANELRSRVPEDVEVLTLHAFGLRAVTAAQGRREIDQWVTANAISERLGRSRDSQQARNAVGRVISLAKSCLASTHDELDALADAHDIDIPRGWDRYRLIATALEILDEDRERSQGPITFDDMIWLPVVQDLSTPTYDWVFVDETQDLSPAQLELVIRAAGEHGRIVAVGDRRQSIYGFRGADRDAIPRMIERLQADVLPLNVTYRCPRNVVAEARELVPAIEAAAGAPEGVVRDATLEQLEADAAPGDFVLSRANAPLVSLCFRWLAAGRRAQIKGRDIGQGLIAWVRGTRATSIPQLVTCLRQWYSGELRRLEALERDTQAVTDRAQCLEALIEGCERVDDVIAKIERLFGEGDALGITLSSTHRAKGLEADRVWVLRDTYLKRDTPEERNLLYVAITRAKNELIYVHDSADAAHKRDAAE